jgi:transposase InsO family protein
MLGFALSDHHPTTDLATAAINMAVAVRGGDVTGVIFHADRGSQGEFNWSLQHPRDGGGL